MKVKTDITYELVDISESEWVVLKDALRLAAKYTSGCVSFPKFDRDEYENLFSLMVEVT